MQHGKAAAQRFTSMIRKSAEKPTSFVCGTRGTLPVILVSLKKPSKLGTDLDSAEFPLPDKPKERKEIEAQLKKPLTLHGFGKIEFKENTIYVRPVKDTHLLSPMKKDFIGYYAHFGVTPPTKAIELGALLESEDGFLDQDPVEQKQPSSPSTDQQSANPQSTGEQSINEEGTGEQGTNQESVDQQSTDAQSTTPQNAGRTKQDEENAKPEFDKIERALVGRVRDALRRNPNNQQLKNALELLKQTVTAENYLTAMDLVRETIAPLLRDAFAEPETPMQGGAKPTKPKQTLPENARVTALLDELAGTDYTGNGDAIQFFGSTTVDGVKDTQREWAINLTVLQAAAAGVDTTTEEGEAAKKALDLRSLAYMLKFANIPNIETLGWQGTPLQQKKEESYHRGGGGPLHDAYARDLAETLGVARSSLFPVTDGRVMESIRRDFQSEGENSDFTTWDENSFEPIFSNLGRRKDVFVDVSGMLAKLGAQQTGDNATKGSDIKAVPQAVTGLVTAALEAECYRLAGASFGYKDMTRNTIAKLGTDQNKSKTEREAELMAKARIDKLAEGLLGEVKKRVTVGGMLAVGKEQALYAFPIKPEVLGDTKGTKVGFDQLGYERFKAIVNHNGFTPGPNQMLENLVERKGGVEAGLEALKVNTLPTVTFPADAAPKRYADLKADFLGEGSVADFAKLTQATDAPYKSILPKITMKMINGLIEEGVQDKLEAFGLGGLLQLSLNRMTGFMDKANKAAASSDMKTFIDQVQLVQSEIANLLAVAKPHAASGVQRNLAEAADVLPDGFPEGMNVTYQIKNSATRCFASTLTGLEDLKESRTGDRRLNVCVQKDTYYEPVDYVMKAAAGTHSKTELDSRDMDKAIEAIKESLKDPTKNGNKLDSMLCEFHHNISYDRKEYKPEDVTAQVRKLFDAGVVANPFTVMIDNTIAETGAKEVKDFFAAFQEEIKDGRLGVVLYRSAQKFDQMGTDDYNGGIVTRVNNGEAFEAFNSSFDTDRDELADQNVQGLTHFNKYAGEELNEYRKAIMANAAKLGAEDSTSPARFPKEMLLKDGNTAALQIAVNTDESAPFLDLRFPALEAENVEAYAACKRVIEAHIAKNAGEMPASSRASFGFPHTNFTLIGGAKLRFNPGLEDEATLAKYRDFFVDVNNFSNQVLTDLESLGFSKGKAANRLNYSLEDEPFSKFAAHSKNPAPTNAERIDMADAWLKAKNPVAALRELAAMVGGSTEELEKAKATQGKAEKVAEDLRKRAKQ